MKRDLVPCPKCGKTVRPGARAIPHEQTAECRVRVTISAYQERGWRAVTSTWGVMLIRAKVPVERAPGQIKTLEETTRDAEGLRTTTMREVVSESHFTPIAAANACEALAKVRITPELRVFAIKMLYEHPEYIATLDAIRRLDGSRAKMVAELARDHGWKEPDDGEE